MTPAETASAVSVNMRQCMANGLQFRICLNSAHLQCKSNAENCHRMPWRAAQGFKHSADRSQPVTGQFSSQTLQ